MTIKGSMTMQRNGVVAMLMFEAVEHEWMALDKGDAGAMADFRGGSPTDVCRYYDNGSSYRWVKMWKPRGLLPRLWHETKLWWQGRYE